MSISATLKKHNFSAGPAILPQSVFEEAAQAVLDFNGVGLSILEMSHRSKEYGAVVDEAVSLIREIGGIDDSYEILFLTGGASSQFYMAPMNLLNENETAAYINTGTWSTKAIKEVENFGNVVEIASSKDKGFSYIPKGYDVPSDAVYLHTTSNNTISGTEYQSTPASNGVPIICDMSSNMFSRPIEVEKYGMIYAGAQKNIGPAGVTLVIIKKDWLGRAKRSIPTMLNYSTHAAKGSMFNTPPAYPIYVLMLTMRWLKAQGGLKGIEEHNIEKANLLYNEIDSNPLFKGTVAKEDRSRMNVTFLPTDPEHTDAFIAMATEAGCSGIKGHRSVGGFRASIYNAMQKESVQVLVDVMREFGRKFG